MVLAELERLNRQHETMRHELEAIRVELASLKVKSGAWGAVGSLVAVAILLGLRLL